MAASTVIEALLRLRTDASAALKSTSAAAKDADKSLKALKASGEQFEKIPGLRGLAPIVKSIGAAAELGASPLGALALAAGAALAAVTALAAGVAALAAGIGLAAISAADLMKELKPLRGSIGFTPEQVQAANDTAAAWGALQAAVKGVAASIGAAYGPVVSQGFAVLLELVLRVKDAIDTSSIAAGGFADAFRSIGISATAALRPVVAQALMLASVLKAIAAGTTDLGALKQAAAGGYGAGMNLTNSLGAALGGAIGDAVSGAIDTTRARTAISQFAASQALAGTKAGKAAPAGDESDPLHVDVDPTKIGKSIKDTFKGISGDIGMAIAEKMSAKDKIAQFGAAASGALGGGFTGLLGLAGPVGAAIGAALDLGPVLDDLIGRLPQALMSTLRAWPRLLESTIPKILTDFLPKLLEKLPEILFRSSIALLQLLAQLPTLLLRAIGSGLRGILEDLLHPFRGEGRRNSRAQAEASALVAANTTRSVGGSVPGFAVGSAYVPYTQLAVVHRGERIVPEGGTTPAGRRGGGGGVTINGPVWGGDAGARELLRWIRRASRSLGEEVA